MEHEKQKLANKRTNPSETLENVQNERRQEKGTQRNQAPRL